MAVDSFSAVAPLILPYEGAEPRFGEGARFLGAGASVLGGVEIGADAQIAAGAAIRGDGNFVRIGNGCFIGEMSTVHIAHGTYPAIIGHGVTVGRNAVVHASTVGDDCVIGDNAVILDGSVLEDGLLVEADSTVFPKSKLATGFVYAGSPAKPVHALMPGELAQRAQELRNAAPASSAGNKAAHIEAGENVFIARTAHLSGKIELAAASSIFFGCHLDAGEQKIVIGENTNIQDNTQILCRAQETRIGRSTTLGHNVRLAGCHIGEHSLIGIGCAVAEGTIIEDGVMLAAGAVTLENQRLEGGWLWGGRPARPLSRLDDAKRSVMSGIVEHYRNYAQAYRHAQEKLTGSAPEGPHSPSIQ